MIQNCRSFNRWKMLFFSQNKIQLNRERKGDNYIYLVKFFFCQCCKSYSHHDTILAPQLLLFISPHKSSLHLLSILGNHVSSFGYIWMVNKIYFSYGKNLDDCYQFCKLYFPSCWFNLCYFIYLCFVKWTGGNQHLSSESCRYQIFV